MATEYGPTPISEDIPAWYTEAVHCGRTSAYGRRVAFARSY